MNQNLTHRKATIADLRTIVNLLLEDELGQTREQFSAELDQAYIDAFYKIDSDSHQYLMIVEMNKKIVGTCHLTIMPSLTFMVQLRCKLKLFVSQKSIEENISVNG